MCLCIASKGIERGRGGLWGGGVEEGEREGGSLDSSCFNGSVLMGGERGMYVNGNLSPYMQNVPFMPVK